MKKILFSLMTLTLVIGLVGAGALAWFSDTETSTDNILTAGTLRLTADGKEGADVESIQVGNIAPGWSEEFRWTLKNTGSLDGVLWFEIVNVVNADNGVTEPEMGSPGEDGTELGELGDYLLHKMNFFKPGTYHDASRPRIGSQTGSDITHWISLNSVKGQKLYYEVNLAAGEEKDLCIVLKVDESVGNCIQGHSVEFDIVFHLEQVQPYLDQTTGPGKE